MTNSESGYFATLSRSWGTVWNQFWFTHRRPETVGLLRLVVGLIAIWWYLSYRSDLEFLFGPQGILDAETVAQWRGPLAPRNWDFSIFDYAETTSALWFTYWIGFAVLMLFATGLFARVATVGALAVIVSLLHRGPMLARPTEDILAMLVFYLCFAPTGRAFALDAILARRRRAAGTPSAAVDTLTKPSLGANIATRLIQIHVVLIHFAMATSQLRDDAWWMGRALWGFIGKPESSYVDLTFLHEHLWVLNVWTHSVLLYELAFALLSWHRLARPILFAAAIPIWVSVGLISGSLDFAAVMLACTLAFVPPEWLVKRPAI